MFILNFVISVVTSCVCTWGSLISKSDMKWLLTIVTVHGALLALDFTIVYMFRLTVTTLLILMGLMILDVIIGGIIAGTIYYMRIMYRDKRRKT